MYNVIYNLVAVLKKKSTVRYVTRKKLWYTVFMDIWLFQFTLFFLVQLLFLTIHIVEV